jgi:hypothetical protein
MTMQALVTVRIQPMAAGILTVVVLMHGDAEPGEQPVGEYQRCEDSGTHYDQS